MYQGGDDIQEIDEKDEILSVLDGEGGRYGLTKDCILKAAEDATALASASDFPNGEEGTTTTTTSDWRRVVVVDSSVYLVQKLVSNLGGGVVSSGYWWDSIRPINTALVSNFRSIGGIFS